MHESNSIETVPRWGRIEVQLRSGRAYSDPSRDVALTAEFTGPSGQVLRVAGFWDGAEIWRIRFSPTDPGEWSYVTGCSNVGDHGLHGQRGRFVCGSPAGETRFERHGPLRLSSNRKHLIHADNTPFLWLADTAWNGPLRATPEQWSHYLRERCRQKFTAVQWVATQWLASPDGDLSGAKAFSGAERITINPLFFQHLDRQMEAVTRSGLLNVPVMLWAAEWSTPEANGLNPGIFLPEDQAIILARYMVARWSSHPIVWVLPGDGNYLGEKAERWKRIGRSVFGDGPRAPVSLHPAGMEWNGEEFRDETWLDILGYQSGHGDDQPTFDWLVSGPPTVDWKNEPARAIINLEPPYEDHLTHQSRQRIDDAFVRRAMYWSLLLAPTAGVSYGGHGVWGWDDGIALSAGHPNAGLPRGWRDALTLPGAEQMRHLASLLESIEWWKLTPAPELLASQPGKGDSTRFVAAAKTSDDSLCLIYIPRDRQIELSLAGASVDWEAEWFDPRTGFRQPAGSEVFSGKFFTPAPGDWVLLLTRNISRTGVASKQGKMIS